jgi:hypothetical protein
MGLIRLKRTLVTTAVAATLVAGGAAASVAGAQQATPTPSSVQPTPQAKARMGAVQERIDQYLSTLAAKLGVSVDKLKQALQETRQELGREANRQAPFRGAPGLPGRPGLPGSQRGLGPAIVRGVVSFSLDSAAKAIGITAEQLRQELPGNSLADVARAHNVEPAKVAEALKADAAARIDQAVANGRLQADRAADLKARAAQQIDQSMNRQVPQRIQPPARGGRRAGVPAAPAAARA